MEMTERSLCPSRGLIGETAMTEMMLELLDRVFSTGLDLGAAPFVQSLASFLLVIAVVAIIKVAIDLIELKHMIKDALKKSRKETPAQRVGRLVEEAHTANAWSELKERW